MKGLAAIAVATTIEPRCDLLHPHRSSLAIATEIEIEDLADQRCFAVVDRELLLVLVATTFEDDRLIAERWRSEEHTSELQSLMRISYAVFCLQKNNPCVIFYI